MLITILVKSMSKEITTQLVLMLLTLTTIYASEADLSPRPMSSVEHMEQACRLWIASQVFALYELAISEDPTQFPISILTNVRHDTATLEIKDADVAHQIRIYLIEHLDCAIRKSIYGANPPRHHFALVQRRLHKLNAMLGIQMDQDFDRFLSPDLIKTYLKNSATLHKLPTWIGHLYRTHCVTDEFIQGQMCKSNPEH